MGAKSVQETSVQETLAASINSDYDQTITLMNLVNNTIAKSKDIATNTVNPRSANAISLNSDIDKGRNI